MKNIFGASTDIVIESYHTQKEKAMVVHVNGLVNKDLLERDLISPLKSNCFDGNVDLAIKTHYSLVDNIPDFLDEVLQGKTALFYEGSQKIFVLDIRHGTPHVLTIPTLFIENLQTSDDYYTRVLNASVLRILRLIGLLITIVLSGLSVAIITFNQEMMPGVFLQTLIASTQKPPLPAGAEVFFLILMFELLAEAGIRLPKVVGSAITIVGALIIGDAAVNAGIVSAPTVIIVAFTAVSSFVIPALHEFITVYRLLLLFLGGTMGLIGIGAGIVIMLTQLVSTDSFGIPILSSFSKEELKDSVIRFPLPSMKDRPSAIVKDNVRRRK